MSSLHSMINSQTDTSFRMPISALLALALASFLTLSTETIPAGMLSNISVGMGVSAALAGQFITIYALGSVLAVIPIITLTRMWPRRNLLLSALFGLLFFNSITAITPYYELALVSRFFAGMAGGVMWGMLAGYARRMVPEHLKGRALAIAGLGAPLALAIGVPLGAWLSQMIGWRFTFVSLSLLTLIAIFWVYLVVPNYSGESIKKKVNFREVLSSPTLRMIFSILVLWVLAHNILYTYIIPYLKPIGLSEYVDVILMIFGLSSMIGVWVTGVFIDRLLARLVILNLSMFALAILMFAYFQNHPVLIILAIFIWGFSVGSSPVLLQTACADAAGANADIAQSILVTMWNFGLAAGGITGGLLLQQYGASSFPWAMLCFVLLALSLLQFSRRFLFVKEAY